MSFRLTPVAGDLLIDRKKELEEMLSEISNKQSKIGFSLTGIRRVGKTSILKEVKSKLEVKGVVVIYISVWNVMPDTLESFVASLFDKVIDAFKDKFPLRMKIANLLKVGQDGVANILQSLKLSVDFGDEIIYTIAYVKGEETNVSKATSNIFRLIDKLAVRTKTKCVLIIDEFPSLTELKVGKKMLGESIIKGIRTINEDYEKTVLVISGSFMHTMQKTVLSDSAPFYRQFVNLEIKPLNEKAVQDFVKKYLDKKINDEGFSSLMNLSSGIPYNLQIIGRELNKSKLKSINSTEISKAVDNIITREGNIHFKDYLNTMQSTEIKVIKVMAVSNVNSPKDIAVEGNMKLNEVTALLQTLLDKGIVKKEGRGKYQFIDNIFKAWLNHDYD